MGKKKRSSSTGSLKSFILLLLILGGGAYFYQNQQNLPEAKELTKELSHTLEKAQEEVAQRLPERSQDETAAQPSANRISSKLEIPVMLTKREEIKLQRTGYTVSYNNFYKPPNWVAWELTQQETKGSEERKNRFAPDPDLPEPRVEHADYTHSGYDRGHMAPAADMKWSKKAMEESFYMSNICPQNQKLNRDDWGDLEELCRSWARKYGTVHITCGPIYDKKQPKRIGEHQVAVPDRFFKVVLIYNRKSPIAMGFLFDNKAHHQALDKYMVSVDSVEKVTGMDFFSKLPDNVENRIEADIPALPSGR